MKRLACLTFMAALVAAVAQVPVGAQSDETPSIKEVMQKLHKGNKAPLVMVKKDLQAMPPKWDEVKKLTKDCVVLGAGLAKNDPPRGDKAHFTKLATEYFENAKAMDEASQKEDKAGVLAGQRKIAQSCKACHDAHRGRG